MSKFALQQSKYKHSTTFGMEDSKKQVLAEQAKKIEEVINVLQTQFGEDYEDEISYLNIVKGNLE